MTPAAPVIYCDDATAGVVLSDPAGDRLYRARSQRAARELAASLGLPPPSVERVRPSRLAPLLARAVGQAIGRTMGAF